MKSIIVYDTATGKTRKIANKMKEVLEKYNHECDIYRDKEIKDDVKSNPQYFDSYDLLNWDPVHMDPNSRFSSKHS